MNKKTNKKNAASLTLSDAELTAVSGGGRGKGLVKLAKKAWNSRAGKKVRSGAKSVVKDVAIWTGIDAATGD